MRVIRSAPVALLLVALIAGCSAPAPQPTPTVTPSASATPSPSPTPTPEARGPVQPAGTPTVIATGLSVPWSLVRLPSGSTLVSERDTALVKEITASGAVNVVGTIPGVVPGGEGGLLGIEHVDGMLYAYFTASRDNRIARYTLVGGPGNYSLGAEDLILTGLVKAPTHNGGRIKVGPDGMLYATVGDARDLSAPQNPASANGKILRMELDGSIPDDNPFPGSYVYSLGHRNPQGLAWDADGQLWAAEFGQNTWDEFNRIEAGGNYGWPVVEGAAGDSRFIDPIIQWDTDDASPSGLGYVDGTFFLAALRGERLWAIYPDGPSASSVAWFVGEYGRLRDVIPGPDGTLWAITNNTSNGTPRDGDDKILQIGLVELTEG